MPEKKTKVRVGLKNFAMLPSYFDYIFVHLRKKVRLKPELSPKFLLTLDPNPAQTRTRPEKPGPTYNSASNKAATGPHVHTHGGDFYHNLLMLNITQESYE